MACDMYKLEQTVLMAQLLKPTYLSLKTAQGKHFLLHRLTECVAPGALNPSEVLSSLLMSAAGILCLIYLCIVRSIASAIYFKQDCL